MKKIITFAVLLMVCSSSLVFAQRRATQGSTVTEYDVRVNANAYGYVYIDGAYVGRTGSSYKVTAGTHSFKVTLGGYKDYETSMNITKAATITATLEALTYNLKVESNVPGSTIVIDGKDMGYLSDQLSNNFTLPMGNHEVIVKHYGYRDFIETVEMNQDRFLRVQLEALTAYFKLLVMDENISPGRSSKNLIKLSIDGKPQPGWEADVMPGKHVITISSGGLQFSQEWNFEPGGYYELVPIFYFSTPGK